MGNDLLIKLFNRFFILLVVSLLHQLYLFEYVYMGRINVDVFLCCFIFFQSVNYIIGKNKSTCDLFYLVSFISYNSLLL